MAKLNICETCIYNFKKGTIIKRDFSISTNQFTGTSKTFRQRVCVQKHDMVLYNLRVIECTEYKERQVKEKININLDHVNAQKQKDF